MCRTPRKSLSGCCTVNKGTKVTGRIIHVEPAYSCTGLDMQGNIPCCCTTGADGAKVAVRIIQVEHADSCLKLHMLTQGKKKKFAVAAQLTLTGPKWRAGSSELSMWTVV